MGNTCSNENHLCTQGKIKNEHKISFQLAKQIFEKDLILQQEVKDAKKRENYIKIIQKIITYKNDNLIQHLINQNNKEMILKFLQIWGLLKFQQIDMPDVSKYNHKEFLILTFKQKSIQITQNYQKIQQTKSSINILTLYQKRKIVTYQQYQYLFCYIEVSFVIFTPQFYHQRQHRTILKNLNKICLQILNVTQISEQQFPFITIVTCPQLYMKVKQTLHKIDIKQDKFMVVVKKSQFILDECGRLCLKASNSGDLIQKSFGNDDFLSLHFEGETVSDILLKKEIEFIVALELQNFNGQAIDYFLWGYFIENFQSFEVIFRCSQFISKQNSSRIVVQSLGRIFIKEEILSRKKNEILNWVQINESPRSARNPEVMKWQGYFIFHLSSYVKIKHNQPELDVGQFIEVKNQKTCYWNPQTKSYQMNKQCIYFRKPLSNFFLRLEQNRTCGIQYEPIIINQKTRKKPSNFDKQFL